MQIPEEGHKKGRYHLVLQLKHTVQTENWRTISRDLQDLPSWYLPFSHSAIFPFGFTRFLYHPLQLFPWFLLSVCSCVMIAPYSAYFGFDLWIFLWGITSCRVTMVRGNLSQGSWPLCNLPDSSVSCQTPCQQCKGIRELCRVLGRVCWRK